MKKIRYTLLAVVALTACTEGEQLDPGPVRDGQIRIASAIETPTESRAAMGDGNMLTDVQFLRRDVAADGSIPSNYFSGAVPFAGTRTNTGSKAIVFADPKPLYRLNNDKTYLVAYHPKATPTSGVVRWAIDAKTDVLLSDIWDAGKYTAPKTGAGGSNGTPMTFRHQLAQLEVVCKASTADGAIEGVVQAAWGNITSIELMNTPSQAAYAYATNSVSYSTPSNIALLKGTSYATALTSEAITTNTANAVTAAGMFAPDVVSGSTAKLRLRVKSVKMPSGAEIEVQLKNGSANAGFVRELKHTVVLSFKPDAKTISVLSTTIEPWRTGYEGTTGVGDGTSEPIPAVCEGYLYWNNPNLIRSGSFNGTSYTILGPGMQSYNNWTGTVANGTNGSYQDSEQELLENEKPWPKLEVAKAPENNGSYMNRDAAMKACQNKTTNGSGWRLPRASELMLIYLNKAELEKTPDFSPFGANAFWSGTESSGSIIWNINFSNGMLDYPSSYIMARCVREMLSPAKVYDYYYSDGITSSEILNGKTAEGVVFWVDPNDSRHFKVLQKSETAGEWGPTTINIGVGSYAAMRDDNPDGNIDSPARKSGKANRELLGRWIADATVNTGRLTISAFPAFEACDKVGAEWYLPAVDELQYLWCAFNGAPPVTWQFGDSGGAPGTVADAQTRFNALFTILGSEAKPVVLSPSYYSSTEHHTSQCWAMQFRTPGLRTYAKNLPVYKLRCIKDVQR